MKTGPVLTLWNERIERRFKNGLEISQNKKLDPLTRKIGDL